MCRKVAATAQHNTKIRSDFMKCNDLQGSSGARSKAYLSDAFSTFIFGNNIFLKRSEKGRRPTEQSMCGCCKEKVPLTPLYFPDTLIYPDTCLGSKDAHTYFPSLKKSKYSSYKDRDKQHISDKVEEVFQCCSFTTYYVDRIVSAECCW